MYRLRRSQVVKTKAPKKFFDRTKPDVSYSFSISRNYINCTIKKFLMLTGNDYRAPNS